MGNSMVTGNWGSSPTAMLLSSNCGPTRGAPGIASIVTERQGGRRETTCLPSPRLLLGSHTGHFQVCLPGHGTVTELLAAREAGKRGFILGSSVSCHHSGFSFLEKNRRTATGGQDWSLPQVPARCCLQNTDVTVYWRTSVHQENKVHFPFPYIFVSSATIASGIFAQLVRYETLWW